MNNRSPRQLELFSYGAHGLWLPARGRGKAKQGIGNIVRSDMLKTARAALKGRREMRGRKGRDQQGRRRPDQEALI